MKTTGLELKKKPLSQIIFDQHKGKTIEEIYQDYCQFRYRNWIRENKVQAEALKK